MNESEYFPPLGFARVTCNVFRSAYPNKRTHDFIRTLKLKSMICLTPNDIKEDLISFCEKNDIKLLTFDIGCNYDPFHSISLQLTQLFVSTCFGKCSRLSMY
jgi:tyrosine-protein phosphatase SIW14